MTEIPSGEGQFLRPPQFPNMPRVPEFGNVFGTRLELSMAGGIPKDCRDTNGGLVPRHRDAVLRYIGDMTRYAFEIGCVSAEVYRQIDIVLKYPDPIDFEKCSD